MLIDRVPNAENLYQVVVFGCGPAIHRGEFSASSQQCPLDRGEIIFRMRVGEAKGRIGVSPRGVGYFGNS